MAVPSTILRAVRGLSSTKRTYTLKPTDDLNVKLPIPKSFGTGNVYDDDVVSIAREMGETVLSGKGQVIKDGDDSGDKPKSESLKFQAGEFADVYKSFLSDSLPEEEETPVSSLSEAHSRDAKKTRKNRLKPDAIPSTNGTASN